MAWVPSPISQDRNIDFRIYQDDNPKHGTSADEQL
jgi:hypothetical protein